MGIAWTLNRGIAEAQGDYIARMDSDDICFANRIEQQVKFLEDNNDIDICGSFVKTFGIRERVSIYPITSDEIRINLMFGCCMAHPTIMFKRRIINEFVYSLTSKVEDYNLWIDLVNKGYKFYNLPAPLLYYRIHESSLSCLKGNDDKKKRLVSDYIKTLKRANNELIGMKLDNEEIQELFLNPDMVLNLKSDLDAVLQTFEKYYEFCLNIMNENDLAICKKALSVKFYEKAVLFSIRGKFTNTKFIKAKFNIYSRDLKKNAVLFFLTIKSNFSNRTKEL